MNLKQELFVNSYLTSGNATQSAIAAGYSPKTAYSQGQRLLKHVEVKEALRERNEQLQSDRILNLEQSLEILSDIATGKLEAERIVFQGEGEAVRFSVKPTITERLKALELRLKTLGAFDQARAEPTIEDLRPLAELLTRSKRDGL